MAQLTTPTFIIGLGGIGNIVARLVWERYLSSGTGLPPTVQIRSIDTASQSEHELARPLPDTMFTKLGGFQANEVVQNLNLFPDVERWWKYPHHAFTPGFIDNGAGARRPVGRLIFFREFTKVYDAIRSDLSEPKRDSVQRELMEEGLGKVSLVPRVFIIGSLAGGTGAGMFLDVALLTRHLFNQLGYQRSAGTITGVFAMPSVIHLASGDPDSTQARERQVNAIGSLSELDFLMSGWRGTDFTIQYPEPVGRFDPLPPVFNQVYLFTDRRLRGVTFTRQADVLQRVAHFIYGQAALGMGEETLKYLDNYKKYFDPAQQRVADGLAAVYCSFGVEWLEVPHQKLLNAWCNEIGESVGERVSDFQWGEEVRRNLDKIVRDRLSGKYDVFRAAIDIVRASADTVAGLRGVPDVQAFFAAIQSGAKKPELEQAIHNYDSELPGMMASIQKLARALPSKDEDVQWVRSFAADLLQSPEFRAGGARRALESAAGTFDLLSATADAVESAAEILKRSAGGLFRRVDVTPALDWARRRLLQQARQAIRSSFGARSSELATLCRAQAEQMSLLQQVARSESRELANRPVKSWAPPADSWMLDERDIAEAVKENREAVLDLVVGNICESLAQEIREGRVPAGSEAKAFFEQRFGPDTVAALERESMKLTKRPHDMLRRIKNRVDSCEPMSHIIDQGAEFLRMMSESNRATPLKIVLTAMGDSERADLERWAQEQRTAVGDQNAFQIAASGDYSRDDVLYLSFGWPLWLFNEVRSCEHATDVIKERSVNTVISSRVLGELPDSASHGIKPMATEQNELLFAYAVVMNVVRPARVDRIVFDSVLFPGEPEAPSLDAAYEQFSRSGLNRAFGQSLKTQQLDGRRFKQGIADALTRLTTALTDGSVPAVLRPPLENCAELVRRDADQISGL